MSDPAFFGYGSLVNCQTHDYNNPRKTTLRGWRRVWQQSMDRPIAFLSIHPCKNSQIEGLLAQVPDGDWEALDQREHAYTRTDITASVDSSDKTAVYIGNPKKIAPPETGHPILLSYLDVVVQGYLHQFGVNGVQRFFDTTDRWTTPILNDRKVPQYPRYLDLTAAETTLVDQHLNRLSAVVKQVM